MRTVAGLIIGTRYLGSTQWGNPMYEVTLSTPTEGFPGTVTLRTMNDASDAYGIENPEYREAPHVFELTRAHRIRRIIGPVE